MVRRYSTERMLNWSALRTQATAAVVKGRTMEIAKAIGTGAAVGPPFAPARMRTTFGGGTS